MESSMKAILITHSNQGAIASRYNIVDYDKAGLIPLGYWLVTDFGNEEKFDLLTPGNFVAQFNNIGPIRNGWVAVQKKEQ